MFLLCLCFLCFPWPLSCCFFLRLFEPFLCFCKINIARLSQQEMREIIHVSKQVLCLSVEGKGIKTEIEKKERHFHFMLDIKFFINGSTSSCSYVRMAEACQETFDLRWEETMDKSFRNHRLCRVLLSSLSSAFLLFKLFSKRGQRRMRQDRSTFLGPLASIPIRSSAIFPDEACHFGLVLKWQANPSGNPEHQIYHGAADASVPNGFVPVSRETLNGQDNSCRRSSAFKWVPRCAFLSMTSEWCCCE